MALALTAESYDVIENDDWRELAACRDTSPDLFFPVGTTGPAIEQIAAGQGRVRARARPRPPASSSPS